MNTNNAAFSLIKNSPITTLVLAGRCEEVQEVSWTRLQDSTAKLLPKIPNNTNLQLEPDTNNSPRCIQDADILGEAMDKLRELLNIKYANIMSQTARDIGRTNLIKLRHPGWRSTYSLKPYTVPLKYHEFIDHKIKHWKKQE